MSEKKTYVFRFDVVESWKASFEASSDEEAARLFKELTAGDLNGDDLPEYVEKNSGIDTEYYVLEDAAGKVIEVEED
jgi:hypothetical protein